MPGPIRTGEVRVVIPVEDHIGVFRDLEFAVDTGFDGFLTLPFSVIEDLGLAPQGFGNVELADTEIRQFGLYDAVVSWNGQNKKWLCFIPKPNLRYSAWLYYGAVESLLTRRKVAKLPSKTWQKSDGRLFCPSQFKKEIGLNDDENQLA